MLALGRKKGESIIINDNIEIVIIDITKDSVRIGIQAPKEISIHRKEVFEQIMKENQQAVLDINIKDLKKIFKP